MNSKLMLVHLCWAQTYTWLYIYYNYVLLYISVTARVGLMHIGVFILLLLSGERNFGVRLNKPYTATIPMDIPVFTGKNKKPRKIKSSVNNVNRIQYICNKIWNKTLFSLVPTCKENETKMYPYKNNYYYWCNTATTSTIKGNFNL